MTVEQQRRKFSLNALPVFIAAALLALSSGVTAGATYSYDGGLQGLGSDAHTDDNDADDSGHSSRVADRCPSRSGIESCFWLCRKDGSPYSGGAPQFLELLAGPLIRR
jgi:hypothetical protein